jgi:hypothetical protein
MVAGVVLIGAVTAIGLLVANVKPGGGRSAAPPAESASSTAPTAAGVGVGPAPGTSGASTTTSPLPTRLTPLSGASSSAPPAPQALDIAAQWGRAWVTHPAGITNQQWLDALRPFTTEEGITAMSNVDPANVPATAVTGSPTVKSSSEKAVVATLPTNGPTLSITVILTPQGWRVAQYDQAA